MASKSVGHHAVNAGMTDATSFGAGVININSDADITLPVISMDCPVLIGLANSLDAARGAGGMDCQLYEIEANSSLQGASAKSRHSTGIIKFIPSTSKRPST